jgi:cellulose synthase operon protein C
MQGVESPSAPSVADVIIDIQEERTSLLDAASASTTATALTGRHGVVLPPVERPAIRMPSPRDLLPRGTERWAPNAEESGEVALLRARLGALAKDPLASARARLELARALRDAGDLPGATASATASLGRGSAESPPAATRAAAHAMLARLARDAGTVDAELPHLEQVAEHAPSPRAKADVLCERAARLELRRGPSSASLAIWREALALAPDHPATLGGLEVALDALDLHAELAAHLAHLADHVDDAELAAWLHTERAGILDRRCGDPRAASEALERALSLSNGIGPVRDACVMHASRHRDEGRLAALLEEEASLESDARRAARLELDAALLAIHANDPVRATRLLERALARARTTELVDGRVVDELLALHEAAGHAADVLRLRRIRLAFASGNRAEARALRAVASAAERAGDAGTAVLALERARMADPEDEVLLGELDRVLVAAGKRDQRVVLWVREAARRDTEASRSEALLFAAESARDDGRPGDALKHLQSAWLATPGKPAVMDAIVHALAPTVSGAERERARERVAMYVQAAETAPTRERRLYYLEKVAWMWDEVLGDPQLAARGYEAVLEIEPTRASAIVGLQTCAARAGDARALARAVLAEAELVSDRAAREALELRAATALETVDPSRCLDLVERLAESTETSIAVDAGKLVMRVHATAGRWEQVVKSLASRAARVPESARLALMLEQAEILWTHLSAPARALRAVEKALESHIEDDGVRDTYVRVLQAIGDVDRLRAGLERLAETAATPVARASLLVRAAELEERRPGGDERAVTLYESACAELSDELIHGRLRRLGGRVDVAPAFLSPLERATALLDSDVPSAGASDAAERLLGSTVPATPALRVAERLARAAAARPLLANVLVMQADAFSSPLAQLRALFALGRVLDETQPGRAGLDPWDRILAAGTADRAAVEAVVRRGYAAALAGDATTADLVAEALRRLLEVAVDDTERVLLCLDAACVFEHTGRPEAALPWLDEARRLDPTSLSAAMALARAANATGERAAGVAAARALAECCSDLKTKAELLRDAADLSIASGDEHGAAELLDAALAADADAVTVAARLAELHAKHERWDLLSASLRRALRQARTAEAIVPIATELADVSRKHLNDPLAAVSALERAREVSGSHTPTLLTLAELYIGQRAWPKALEVLGVIVEKARESTERHVALMGIASIEGKVLGNTKHAQEALRAAIVIDDAHPRALRMMVDTYRGTQSPERTGFLSRLAACEPDRALRRKTLLELADARHVEGDATGVEDAVIEAAALSEDNVTLQALGKIAGKDRAALARLMGRVITRARELGTPQNPAWLAMLGDIEVEVTQQHDAGVAHLEEALRLDTTLHAARLPLATALVNLRRHEEAVAVTVPVLGPERSPAMGALRREPRMIRLLESALAGMGRLQEAHVMRELRGITGDIDDAALLALDGRHHAYAELEPIGAPTLFEYVLPEEGRHPAVLVAAACAPLAGKLARVTLAELGASTRDRIKPRTAVPLRQLFDRATRAFGITDDIELAVSDAAPHAAVAIEDEPWILLPSSFAMLPEPRVMATLGRLLFRVALGVPWLNAVPRQTVVGIVAGWMRVAAPEWQATPDVDAAASEYEPRARRALDRKRRRSLEELGPRLADAPPLATDELLTALDRAEARAAYLLGGDLRWAIEQVTAGDASLGQSLRVGGQAALVAILGHPTARDLVRWAIGSDAIALRRRLGTLWV